ncbi:MAG: hypothetical protein K8R23_15715 [Chthoniobacter sp.]|nr:hypothetical protein [Chthoniobacter sp.]
MENPTRPASSARRTPVSRSFAHRFFPWSRPDPLEPIKRRFAELRTDSDTRLREHADALRAQPCATAAVALMAEAVRRVHGITPYDVQLTAGLTLAEGRLAEMATGEGKTLVALLPAFFFGLHGHGAHVATVNAYLAQRDCEFARPSFALLGLTVGLLAERADRAAKRAAYLCDVTYGVGTEFGFDYLRDQVAIRAAHARRPAQHFHHRLLGQAGPPPDVVQRGQAFAVIDEADSVLIDEASSPLVIAMGAKKPSATPEVYLLADRTAAQLRAGEDFAPDATRLALTPTGERRALDQLTDDVLPHLRRRWSAYVESALRARQQFRRDVHYVLRDDAVVIVDEFTGRPCPDRSWREGLHQAVEAAAGTTITDENCSDATITRPAYFRLYRTVCGMSGTAREAAPELQRSYRLRTTIIPLHRPSRRIILPDRVFRTRAAKLAAVTAEVARCRAKGQPVLIGTRTIENSEALAAQLTAHGIPFRLLNAKQDAGEAAIIEQAGEPGTVTIATNMAGRGAHIPVPEESQRVGGLHVIGLERHESARIDRQLMGRAARQGQPGSGQFFLSLEDDLLQRHAPALAARLATTADAELPASTAAHFLRTQRRVEAADREQRRQLARYDEWLDELKRAL